MKKYIEKRPWGKFDQFTHNEISTVKILTVEAGKRLSLQFHKQREEFWRVIEGNGKITIGEKILNGKTGDEFLVKKGQKHRIEGGKNGIKILEIALGNFEENDNIRLEDDYGRGSPKKEK
jgi:mannose-6-phosphate isomerase-like protein (cupin superfamily)